MLLNQSAKSKRAPAPLFKEKLLQKKKRKH